MSHTLALMRWGGQHSHSKGGRQQDIRRRAEGLLLQDVDAAAARFAKEQPEVGLIAAEAFKVKIVEQDSESVTINLSDPSAVPEEEPATAVEEACRRSAPSPYLLSWYPRGRCVRLTMTDAVPADGLIATVVRACKGWAPCNALATSAQCSCWEHWPGNVLLCQCSASG